MIQVNDRVEARLNNGTESVVVQHFVVTAINGTSYEGGGLPCDTEDGWMVHLSVKHPDNLALPTASCEIVAFDRSNVPHVLVGKEDTWKDERGFRFPVEDIFSWVPVGVASQGVS
jgi:hypothetical protein